MSYTPYDQLLHDRIQAFLDAGDELFSAVQCRLDHRYEWTDSHLQELEQLFIVWDSQRGRLKRLQGKTD